MSRTVPKASKKNLPQRNEVCAHLFRASDAMSVIRPKVLWTLTGAMAFAVLMLVLVSKQDDSKPLELTALAREQEQFLSEIPLEPNLVRTKRCSLQGKWRIVYACTFESKLNGSALMAYLSKELEARGWTALKEHRFREYGVDFGYTTYPFCKQGREISFDFPTGVSRLRHGDTVHVALISGGDRCST